MAIVTVLHAGLQFGYVAVARCAMADNPDSTLCEVAFEATNSIEAVWHEVGAARFGLFDVRPSRSTSFGDVVRIEDNAGVRFYECDDDGWTRLHDEPLVTAA